MLQEIIYGHTTCIAISQTVVTADLKYVAKTL